jgi:hypothetical protein
MSAGGHAVRSKNAARRSAVLAPSAVRELQAAGITHLHAMKRDGRGRGPDLAFRVRSE